MNPLEEIEISVLDVRVGDWVARLPYDWLEVKMVASCEATSRRVPDGAERRTPCVIFEGYGGSTSWYSLGQKVLVRRLRDGWRNYHMILAPDRSAVMPEMTDDERVSATVWSCSYCYARGTFDEMRKRTCGHVYETCEHCGGREGSNECKLDCSGMAEALGDPGIYLAGFPPERH